MSAKSSIQGAFFLFGVFLLVFGMVIFGATELSQGRLVAAMRMAAIAMGIAVLVSYWRIVPEIFGWSDSRRVRFHLLGTNDLLGLALVFKWVGTIGLSIWHLIWRLADFPMWMAHSDMNALWLGFIFMGGVFQLAAPGSMGDGRIPRVNQIWIGGVVGASVALFLLVLAFADSFPAIAEWLRVRML